MKINIVGQGLAGSILGYMLKEYYHCQVHVFNNEKLSTSSAVAAGIYNPITGKRMAKTWFADTIFPFMFQFYSSIESKFNIKILHQTPVFKPFADVAEQNFWMGKSVEDNYKNDIEIVQNLEVVAQNIDKNFGGMIIKNSGRLDINLFLEIIKSYFIHQNCYFITEKLPHFDDNEIVIYCEGAYAATNPLWSWLPWQCNKGEIIDIALDASPMNFIINSAVFMMPISNDRYRVGATYHQDDLTAQPSQKGIEELKNKLESFLIKPYQIKSVQSGIRPAVQGRRPFLGQHPTQKNTYIFNGFGSKAVSMAPYFANHFAQYLLHNQPLLPDVQLNRTVQW